MTFVDKRERAARFRERLTSAMAARGLSRAGLARTIGADRSTVSQLLSEGSARLPNAQLVAEAATALGVSADWLLSLSDRPEQAQDLVAASITLSPAERALVDEEIFAWHREAEGYKIRHVPAGLPDILKTRDILDWEYTPHLGQTAAAAIAASEERLDWMRSSPSDYEIAIPLYEVASLVAGTGYYASAPEEARAAQVDRLIALHEQLYPSLRVFLFDARRLYSAPITIFGPLLAVIYVGQHHLAFRDRPRVAAFTQHFDHLIREASVSARGFPGHLKALKAEVAAAPSGPTAASSEGPRDRSR